MWKTTAHVFVKISFSVDGASANADAVMHINERKINEIRVYTVVDSLQLASWIPFVNKKHDIIKNVSFMHLLLSAKAWWQWTPQTWKIVTELNALSTDMEARSATWSVDKLSGFFWMEGTGQDHWSAHLHTRSFTVNTISYPETDVFMQSYHRAGEWIVDVVLPRTDLAAVRRLLTYGQSQFETLEIVECSGMLLDTKFRFFPSKKFTDFVVVSKFENVSLDHWRNIPQIQNISGEFNANAHGGSMRIASQNVSIKVLPLFKHTWHFNTVVGNGYWKLSDKKYTLLIPELKISGEYHHKDDVAFNGTTAIKIDVFPRKKYAIHMTLQTVVERIAATDMKQFMPYKILSKQLSHGLKESLNFGVIKNNHFLWHGPLTGLQIGNYSWSVGLKLQEGLVRYNDDWPEMSDVVADVKMNQNRFLVQKSSGRIGQSTIDDVRLDVPVMRVPVVKLFAGGLLKGKDVEQILRKKMLSKPLHGLPHLVNIYGEFTTTLALSWAIRQKNSTPQWLMNTEIKKGV